MQIYKLKNEVSQFLRSEKRKGLTIGFIPTMGALHEGHLSLVRTSLKETDLTVCSVYVNPVQFNNIEDFSSYPKNLDSDLELLESAGCQCVFTPENDEMYEGDFGEKIKINFGKIETLCEGKYRPGHFSGVGLVVSKFFNIIQPDKVYFGQKDLQQVTVIKKLIKDLSYNIVLRMISTIREADGLAMSSRNLRIEPAERAGAVIFYHSLINARNQLLKGITVGQIKKNIEQMFENDTVHRMEYLELIEYESFEIVREYTGQHSLAFCIAGYLRNIRLIDNILIND